MTSDMLLQARQYEALHGSRIPAELRPAFHLTPWVGWLNDPNGFSYYGGKYHLFYQYHPFASHWDTMYWGHAVSADLLHWEYLPAALAPDMPYDRDGCFSGSAVTMPDGRHLIAYTGVRREKQTNGQLREVQTQNLALGDGVDYVKFSGNPILTEAHLPQGGSRFDFRDPKLYHMKNGAFCMAVGSRAADGGGQILLYRSPDGLHWSYWRVLAANRGRYGKMWECPDFFALDGAWVLLVSPQDMLPDGFEYHNGNGTLALIGAFDEATGEFREERDQAVDYGIDFYAPQTLRIEDGRRIMIGWMQNWDACAIRMPEAPWAGQMSVPRELSLRNGRLYQTPLRELLHLRKNAAVYRGVRVSGEQRFHGVRGRMLDLLLSVRPADPLEMYHKFSLRFAENERYHTSLSFRPRERTLKVDRKFSGSRRAIIHQRRCLVSSTDGCLKLRVILDRFSVEAFINDGEQVMSATLYTDPAADGISFFADGNVTIDIEAYTLCP